MPITGLISSEGNPEWPDLQVADGDSFQLDGSGSRAVPPRVITQYRWRRLPPADV